MGDLPNKIKFFIGLFIRLDKAYQVYNSSVAILAEEFP